MIHATKADVDRTKKDLADHLEDLAHLIRSWQAHPHSTTQKYAARLGFDTAEQAFAEYEQTLKTWAAGPGAGAL